MDGISNDYVNVIDNFLPFRILLGSPIAVLLVSSLSFCKLSRSVDCSTLSGSVSESWAAVLGFVVTESLLRKLSESKLSMTSEFLGLIIFIFVGVGGSPGSWGSVRGVFSMFIMSTNTKHLIVIWGFTQNFNFVF